LVIWISLSRIVIEEIFRIAMVEGVSELCPVRCADHHKLFGCPVSLRRGVLWFVARDYDSAVRQLQAWGVIK
jgi:hypothetical protein